MHASSQLGVLFKTGRARVKTVRASKPAARFPTPACRGEPQPSLPASQTGSQCSLAGIFAPLQLRVVSSHNTSCVAAKRLMGFGFLGTRFAPALSMGGQPDGLRKSRSHLARPAGPGAFLMSRPFSNFLRKATAIALATGIAWGTGLAMAQLEVSDSTDSYLIDFSTTIGGVNNGTINGTGFSPTPSPGQLDSDAWAATGMSDGPVTFGGTATTGDAARGTSISTTGGFYGLTVSGNSFLALRPGGSDWTPGTLTLRIQNTSGSTITGFTMGYDIMVLNDQGRSNSFNFRYSVDDATYTNVGGLDYTSDATATPGATWSAVGRSTGLTGLNVANNEYFYLRWFGDDVGGSGSRDGFGLDNLALSAFTTLAAPSGAPIYWDANGTAADIGGTGTWEGAGALFSTTDAGTDATTRAAADEVIFAGTAGTVTVSGGVNADAGITFNTDGYTLSSGTLTLGGADAAANTISVGGGIAAVIDSVISGSTGLTKSGSGSLTLSGANTYTGGTTVSGGTLVGTTTSLTGNITNNSTVSFDQADDGTYAGDMDGSGSLTKSGAGNLTLSGSNSYAGGTTVSAGTLTGSTGSLQGDIANNAAVVFDQAADGDYAGAMTGTGSLTKNGAGNLTLSGANDYSGGTTVSAGTLTGSTTSLQGDIANDAAMVFSQDTGGIYAGGISGTGSLAKSGTGTVTLTGANSYSGGTTVSAGTLAGSTASLAGDIANDATLKFTQAADGTYSGTISGTGGLEVAGPASVTLANANTYSGGTTISGGTLVAGNAAALSSGTVTLTGGGLVAVDGLTIANSLVANAPSGGFIISEYVEGSSNNKYIELYNGTGATINLADYQLSLFGNGASTADTTFLLNGVGAGETLAAGETIVIAHGSAALTLPAGVTAFTTASSLTFFNGDDALALQRADGSFIDIFGRIGDDPGSAWTAGATSTVNQTLVRNADVTSGVSVNPSGTGPSAFTTLGTEWTSYPQDTVSSLGSHTMNASTGSVLIGATADNAAVVYSGGLTLTSNADLTAAAGGTTAFSGDITGSGGIDKLGAGTVVLSGTNTFSGGTTVSAGTLSAAADAAFGDSSGGITLAGGTLELTSGFTLGSGRTLTAAESTASTITIGSGLTVTFDGPVAGSGDLDKAGAGQLTLGNASTGYTGSFTISAGTVELTAANAFANATVTQTGGTLLLNPAGGGTDVDVPDFGGVGGEVSVASSKNANFGSETDRAYRGRIRGQGGLKKSGNGRLTLDQDNDFAGATEVTAGILEIAAGGALSETSAVSIATGGRLLLNGRVGRSGNAANVSVSSGGILSGSGQVFGTVGGAGSVGPGNSPGIFEATATDPSSGLDYAFEFTGLSPDYANSAASINDLFRLTDTSTPFGGSLLDASNVIDVYFDDGSFAEGRTYAGGFFLDATSAQMATFLDTIDSATFNYFVADAGGGVSYAGTSYLSLADYNTANSLSLTVNLGVATIPSAAFAGGTVTNGQAMQMVVVPEPDAFLLGGLGLALVGLLMNRRRQESANRSSFQGATCNE